MLSLFAQTQAVHPDEEKRSMQRAKHQSRLSGAGVCMKCREGSDVSPRRRIGSVEAVVEPVRKQPGHFNASKAID